MNDYPNRETFEQITQEGEDIGLYDNTRRIGFKQNWLKLIANKGYSLDADGRLYSKAKPTDDSSHKDLLVGKSNATAQPSIVRALAPPCKFWLVTAT